MAVGAQCLPPAPPEKRLVVSYKTEDLVVLRQRLTDLAERFHDCTLGDGPLDENAQWESASEELHKVIARLKRIERTRERTK